MANISRLACIIAVIAAGITSPAFAQSAKAIAPQHRATKVTVPQSGVNSFAMVPHGGYDPALTGGGSIGYNESLSRDQ
jgi:hypothetical protein